MQKLFAITAAMSLAASPAYGADTGADAAPNAAAMQRVEVAGHAAQAQRRNETAGRIVVGRAELLQYGDGALSGALQRLPGVTVSGNEVRMRGLGGGYTQILINGDPAPPGFSIDGLSPELVERIEILRSPTADSSAQAIAGSINIVLRRATQARREVKLAVARSQAYSNPSATVQTAGRDGGYAYTLAATLARSGEDSLSHTATAATDADGAPVSRRHFDERFGARVARASLAPRLEWKSDGNTLVWQTLLDAVRIHNWGTVDETTLLGPSTASPHAEIGASSHAETLRSDATWSRPLGDGRLEAKGGMALNRRHGDYLFDGAGLRRAVLSGARDDSASLSGKATLPLGAGHGFGAGWDGTATRRGETRLQRDTLPQGAPPALLDQHYSANVRRLALYVQDEWEAAPDLQLYAGLRWEALETTVAGRTMATTGTRAKVWSPVAQALWKDGAHGRLRLALARTYKAPATSDLVPRRYTVNNDNGPTSPHQQGNPQLRPELAWGVDGGYEYYPGGQDSGVIGIAAYARRVTDVTVRRLFQDGAAWVATPANGGKAAVHGIEFDMKLAPISWSGVALAWRANAARNWSRLDSVPGPDNRLADQTPLSANLGLDVRPGGAWSMGASLLYKGGGALRRSQELAGATGPERKLDWYWLWQGRGGRQWRIGMTDTLAQQRHAAQRYQDAAGSMQRDSWSRGARALRIAYEAPLASTTTP